MFTYGKYLQIWILQKFSLPSLEPTFFSFLALCSTIIHFSVATAEKQNPEGFNKINSLFLTPFINTIELTHTLKSERTH